MDISKDYIEYRSFNGVNVPIMTIPKGSLLFRLVYNSEQEKTKIDKMMKETFLGLTMPKPIRNFNDDFNCSNKVCLDFTNSRFLSSIQPI